MATEFIARYRRPGFSLTVYPNRLEAEKLGCLLFKNKQIIPSRNVANVEVAWATSRVTVKTNDGKCYRWSCGFQARKIHKAILSIL